METAQFPTPDAPAASATFMAGESVNFYDPLLLSCVRILTFSQGHGLTNATGFFFSRNEKLFLVTNRHVLQDQPSGHSPDSVDIEVHVNKQDIAQSVRFSIPLYQGGRPVWRQGTDSGGEVDVAVIEIDRPAWPTSAMFTAFTLDNLVSCTSRVEVGSALLIVGFPLGFQDSLHHLPVVRQAVIASSYGLRFQGKGYFLTDARTHRGTSGASVVMRCPPQDRGHSDLPWMLLGIHAARLDVGSRDWLADESLGLNSAWYADILLALTF
jgi:hypothetical protein